MSAPTAADVPSSGPASQVNPKGAGDEMSGARSRVGLPGGHLLGRERERDAVDRLLDGGRAGRGGVMVVHGEPGIGKTALLGVHLRQGESFVWPAFPELRLRWSWRSRRCSGCACRTSSLWSTFRSRSATPLRSRSDSVRGRLKARSWSGWRSSASSRRLPRSVASRAPSPCTTWLLLVKDRPRSSSAPRRRGGLFRSYRCG